MTARIRVLEAIAGDDFAWSPGDVVELPDEQAAAWADGHRAELADGGVEPRPVEQAPLVVAEDGQELAVVDAVREECTDPGANPGEPPHVRWRLTVELPSSVPVGPTQADGDPKQEVAVFDPAEHKVDEVLTYLATVDEGEVLRVLNAEAGAKKPRASIVNARDTLLAEARERAAGGEQQAAEKAAEASRGGGRSDDIETRG